MQEKACFSFRNQDSIKKSKIDIIIPITYRMKKFQNLKVIILIKKWILQIKFIYNTYKYNKF
jgi:hypothetical protein